MPLMQQVNGRHDDQRRDPHRFQRHQRHDGFARARRQHDDAAPMRLSPRRQRVFLIRARRHGERRQVKRQRVLFRRRFQPGRFRFLAVCRVFVGVQIGGKEVKFVFAISGSGISFREIDQPGTEVPGYSRLQAPQVLAFFRPEASSNRTQAGRAGHQPPSALFAVVKQRNCANCCSRLGPKPHNCRS